MGSLYQAPLYHRGWLGVPVNGAAGGDLDQGHDEKDGARLETVTSPYLLLGTPGLVSFSVAGAQRRDRNDDLWPGAGCFIGGSRVLVRFFHAHSSEKSVILINA